MYKHPIFWALATLLLFAAVMTITRNHGNNNRFYGSGQTNYVVDSTQKAYSIWDGKNVKGRTLILFDGYPHNMGYYSYNGNPRLLETNLIEYSIFQNIIRRIYLIVPEEEWIEFRHKAFIRPIREASNLIKGLYLYNQSGIPIVAVTPSSLPHIREPVLVYINSSRFRRDEAMKLLSQNNISSDITIVLERAQ